MTFDQLRIFVAVAEREHMTRAAEALGIAQSAVSAAVSSLEARHGVPLFHRVGRRIELTEAGRLFLVEAKAVLMRAETAERALQEFGTLQRGTLAVHASQTIASYWLPGHLVRFHRAYPQVDVRLAVGNTAQVAEAVKAGSAELGFVEGMVDDPALSEQTISGDRLVIVVGVEHPWAKRKRVEPADLAEAEWVVREPGSGTRSEFETALRLIGIKPRRLKIALELPSNEAVRSAVVAGAGVTAISELVVEALIRLGRMHKVGFDLPPRSFHVLRHRERYRSKAAQALLATIAEPPVR
ncbi:MAG TPA: LysR substrate-binding domain-containing protein [Alphaproteobacteria bacterium]|nr:LysR substrate-binding domain-containing protein [Alphaproteobacteria bacterium]